VSDMLGWSLYVGGKHALYQLKMKTALFYCNL
jgi:hypothetical protein